MTVAVSGETSNVLVQQFDEIYRKHYAMVYRTAYSLLDNRADAEDVLQTIFLRLLRREFPPDFHENAPGYFYRAAVNLSLDTIRSRRRYGCMDASAWLDIPADSSEADMAENTHRRLTDAIAQLDPSAVEILILHYVHDYSDAKIAKLLGASRVAIAVRLFRSRARLKRLMETDGR